MPKKNIVLGVILGILLVVSLVVMKIGKPGAGNINPLKRVDIKKIEKIELKGPSVNMELSHVNGAWTLTQPVQDWVDPQAADQLVETLSGFAVGSIISENPENYSNFRLGEEEAVHLQVFMMGQQTPQLNGWVGKGGSAYGKSYFRFESPSPVYVTSDLPQHIILKTTESYREKRLIPVDFNQINKLIVKSEIENFELVRSSESWVLDPPNELVSASAISGFVRNIEVYLKANRLATEAEIGVFPGNPPEIIMIEAVGPEKTTKAIIYSETTPPVENMPILQYAKTEGRPTLLLLAKESVNIMIDTIRQFDK